MNRLSREFNTCPGLYLRIERADSLPEVTLEIQNCALPNNQTFVFEEERKVGS